ncbi:hypothetical protein SAMN04488065_1393 [Haloplanus vescus]|uniref:Uncharacterized protein n=1 Tax=Haloplanus vescus TaxID=555874 RepID=A0A1H3X9B6_9EURY|nr:hypothetical protein [Haloplanus vescus]SDZ95168.1 hypothetical protein SAMN04488065_1393 [Haloplanus vescus]
MALLQTETKIVLGCMFLGLTSWYLARQVTQNSLVSFATLLGIGVILPTLINEWRRRSAS